MNMLIQYERACAELEKAARVDELKHLRDKAIALQLYARQANDGTLLDHATEIRLRAERKAGALLSRMAKDGERDAGKGGDRKSPLRAERVKLSDIGISETQSHRWQKLTRIDESEFELLVVERKRDALRATQASRAERQAEKKERRAERETQLAENTRALPGKKYNVIYADPEWRFEVFSRETGMDRAADNHYPTSSVDEICARDVASIAADDCVLFLWVTTPFLGEFHRVLAAWGFVYKSCIVWAKDKAGTGYWTRDRAEHLIIATRGDIPAPAMGDQVNSLIEAPVGAHSAKPERFAEIIEGYFPHLPKIELNRRGPPRPGWDAWGNEASS